MLQALGAVTSGRDLERAGELFRQALEIRRTTLPEHHPDLAQSLSSLAGYHRGRREYTRARDLYLEALAVFPRPEDRRHPINISIRNDLASTLSNLNEHGQAEAMQLEAIEIGRQVLGAESAAVAELINNLAVTQAHARNYPEAERSFRTSFQTHRALFGEEHWRTRNTARNVGRVLEMQGRYGEALGWMDRANSTTVGRAGDDSGVLLIRAQRAQVLFRLGRRDEAMVEASTAVKNLEQLQSRRAAWNLACARVLLGRMLVEAGRPGEAEATLAAALDYFAGDEPEFARRAEASCELGRARVLQGGGAEDRRRLRECLPVYRAWGLADRVALVSMEKLVSEP